MTKDTEQIMIESYYGKEIFYIVTTFKNDKLDVSERKVTVWNPADKKMIAPADGCDIIINDSSTTTDTIFEIGGIRSDLALFSLKRYNTITLYNYCKADEVEEVKMLHKSAIKGILKQYNTEMMETIKQQEKLLKSL